MADNDAKLIDAVKHNRNTAPKRVIISTTDTCNLRCRTCWRLEKDYEPNEHRNEELSLEQIKRILRDCKRMGVKEIDLTGGGEPFARGDILDIIKSAKKHGLWVTLTSNGTLLTGELLRRIVKVKLDDICFSVDGSCAGLNDQIRGKGCFDRCMSSVEKLQKIKAENSSDKPVTRFSSVINRLNISDLPNIIELAARHNVRAVYFSVLVEWKTNRMLSLGNMDTNGLMNSLRLTEKTAGQFGIGTNLSSVIRYGLFEHKTPDFCFAPWETLFINSRGNVLACCMLATFYENVIGNVRKHSINKIWSGPEMKEFRERLLSRNFYQGCRRCLPEFVDRYDRLWGEISHD